MNLYRRVLLISSIAIMAIDLSGCAMMPAYQNRQNACASSPVIYTDLTQSAKSRPYQLPNGTDCSEFYDQSIWENNDAGSGENV